MTKTINYLLCFFIVQFAFSQDYKFGKVSKEELEESVCSVDVSASAAILYSYRSTYFTINASGIVLNTEIHKRVKIYNKEGFEHASEEINLFKVRNDDETISRIKAVTYNLENGKIVETDLDKDQVFKSDFSYNYNQVKFTMPNIKEGSVIEFKYKISSPFYWNIDEFVLQSDIPIKMVEAKLKTPEGLNFKQTSKGFVPFYPKRSTDYSSEMGMNMDVMTYILTNVPALKAESYVDNMDNYRAGAMFELVSITIPGQFQRYYAQDWGDVAKTIGNTDDYENQLDKSRAFDDILDNLLADKTSQIDKMKTIFKYVKDKITWNGIDGKYFYNGIRKTLVEKKGNVADINLTLVAMLRYAGINANPVVISTKDNVIPFFPTVDRLNYVIAYAVINDKPYYLDATEEFSDINMLPVKDYNWKGIFIDNNNMVWKKIDLSEPEQAMADYNIQATLNQDGSLEGTLNSRYTKHRAYDFRESYKDQDEDAFIASREEGYGNIEISSYNVKNHDVYEGNVEESFEYFHEAAAEVIDDKIYFEPLSILKLQENPFKLEERLFPIDFGYPFADRFMVSITIPEGYKAENQITPVVMNMPNKLGEFKYQSKLMGNKLQLMVIFKINKAILSADNYLFLKEFFNQVIKKESEQIVLIKA